MNKKNRLRKKVIPIFNPGIQPTYIKPFQHFRAIQFSDQTKQITGAVCAQTGNGPRTGGQGSYGPNGRPNFGNKNANRLG